MLPDFTRIAWASPQAQSVWQERVRRVTQAWEQIERLSVQDGLRSSALQNVTPDALPLLGAWAASVGLHVVVLERVGVRGNYTASHVPVTEGQGWAYRVAVATPAAAMRWPEAWRNKDDEAIGKMLGFPFCCREFFAKTWGTGLVDTTHEMTGWSAYDWPPEANILLRWLGVRAVTHLPCSFVCEASARIGREFIACGRQHWFGQEMDWLEQMLDWPVEWSALHGIAEIVTPVCRIQTRTNYSSDRQVIRREGQTYPEEGARGVRFPFRMDCEPAKPLPLVDPREWTDNGFSSKEAMDAAHARILAAIGPGPFRCVVDFGCGNGALLRKIPAERRIGVESDGKKRSTGLDDVYWGDCTDPYIIDKVLSNEQPDLIIAQAHRNPPEMFLGYRVLSYSYDEPTFARLVTVPESVTV
jgi:hypothetical protein